MLGLVIIMMLLSFVPLKFYMNTFWSLRYLYILVAFICASFRMNMSGCLVVLSKIVVVVEYLNIISYTTSPSESAYGIEKFLSYFNILLLPISGLAFKINSILRYVPLLLTVEHKTLKAQASRGIDYYHTNIFGRMYAVCNLYLNVHTNLPLSMMSNVKFFILIMLACTITISYGLSQSQSSPKGAIRLVYSWSLRSTRSSWLLLYSSPICITVLLQQ